MFVKIKKKGFYIAAKSLKKWPHLGSNQGLDDYESSTLTNWVIGPYEFLYLKNSKNLFPLFLTSFFPSKWLRATDYESGALTNWAIGPRKQGVSVDWCAKIIKKYLLQNFLCFFLTQLYQDSIGGLGVEEYNQLIVSAFLGFFGDEDEAGFF